MNTEEVKMEYSDVERINKIAKILLEKNQAKTMHEAVEKAKDIILEKTDLRQGYSEELALQIEKEIEDIQARMKRSLEFNEKL